MTNTVMTGKEIVNMCFKESLGNKKKFIELLEKHGYTNNWNSYQDHGSYVAVYTATNTFSAYSFES